MRNTKWNIKNLSKNKDIKINNIPVDNDILKILFSRGIKSEKEIKRFLNPQLDNLQDPHGLFDMEKAVEKIVTAIQNNLNIWIYGDYDVDGITSTSVLYLSLIDLGAKNVNYYIPVRDEGYGLNNSALKKIKDSGGDIVITVDCGISSFDEVEFASSIGLPIIITDHHGLNGNRIPNAFAVINPKRQENSYSFESLAGVGTVFMLVLCLFEAFGKRDIAFDFLDLVAIGTVADIVPLLAENRILTKFGLEQLPYTRNKGLRFLLYKLFNSGGDSLNNPKTEYSSYDVGFIIAPIFNAAGRLKDAKMVVKLLTSDNNREIEMIVEELISKNYERKELQNRIVEMIEKNIESSNTKEDAVILDYSPEYHHGVIGIAASKIVDTYYRPVIIMEVKEDEGVAVASCRSIEGFNILSALQSMQELFIKFGGHSAAAGFTIPIKNIELFRKKINRYAEKILKEEDFVKVINIDKQIPIQKISYEFFKTIELLKPFGFGNPMPTFQTRNILLENIKYIGENRNHIMFDLKQKGFLVRNAVWFSSGEYFKELNENLFYDIVYKLKVEEFQDKYYTKVYVEDMKVSSLKDDSLVYYHSLYNTSFPLKSIFYTHLEPEGDIPLTSKYEFEQVSLFQGRKLIGRLDYNISNLLIQLKRYYNWNFSFKLENVIKSTTHNIVEVLIKRDYSFDCYDHTDMGIFKRIKEFLIGNMEYDSYTKNILSLFFKQEKNLLISQRETSDEEKKGKNQDAKNLDEKQILIFPKIFMNFLLTVGIYNMKKYKKKSLIITEDIKNFPYNNSFIKYYFDIGTNIKKFKGNEYPFIFLYDEPKDGKNTEKNPKNILSFLKEIYKIQINTRKTGNEELQFEAQKEEILKDKKQNEESQKIKIQEKEFFKRFCIYSPHITKATFDFLLSEVQSFSTQEFKTGNISLVAENTGYINMDFINIGIKIPKNVVFLDTLNKKELKDLKNIYVEYLPLENKVEIKKLLKKGENIYSDTSITEIF